ncbi:MAG: hypothetical protein J7J54_03130 [Candidatus Omnitrophica bacterium]|nr:hypothetical protein [Candidatus Omnitrophota bacterium]
MKKKEKKKWQKPRIEGVEINSLLVNTGWVCGKMTSGVWSPCWGVGSAGVGGICYQS